MSGTNWNIHIDHLKESGQISDAAIVGAEKGGVWAVSENFKLSREEELDIVSFFESKEATETGADTEKAIKTGVHLANAKYFTLTTSDDMITLRKGPDGALLVKTKQAIIVALYKPPTQAQEALGVVHAYANYLRGYGF